jgi:hypothetical protein
MDDILMVYVDKPNMDTARFQRDFDKSECYLPPLKLEDAGDCTFLETTFKVSQQNDIQYWLTK